MRRPEIKVNLFPVAVEQHQREKEAGALADNGGQGGAPGPHLHRADKEQVQHQVQHGSDGDEHEGML